MDNGTTVAGIVRYFRTCADYGFVGETGLGNHFLGGNRSAPGHHSLPTGFAWTDGTPPVGMEPCGACAGDQPFWELCGMCPSPTLEVGYSIEGPDPGSEEHLEATFYCDGEATYLVTDPVVDELGFTLVEAYFTGDYDVLWFRFRAPDGSMFAVATDFEGGDCPSKFWSCSGFAPVPTMGDGWKLYTEGHFG